MLDKVKREIKILRLFQHPNIIRLYEVIEDAKKISLVMEYLPGGELYNVIERSGRIPEDEARNYF